MAMQKVRLQRDFWGPNGRLYRAPIAEIPSEFPLPKKAQVLGAAVDTDEAATVTPQLTSFNPNGDVSPQEFLDPSRAAGAAVDEAYARAAEVAEINRKKALAAAFKRSSK